MGYFIIYDSCISATMRGKSYVITKCQLGGKVVAKL